MINSLITSVFFLIMNSAYPDQSNDYKQIDDYLSAHWKVSQHYFDSLLKRDPKSQYLIGMKYYFSAEDIDVKIAKSKLDKEVKEKGVSGAYIDLAYAKISISSGDNAMASNYLQRALVKDGRNKWALYEEYLLHREDVQKAKPILDLLTRTWPSFSRATIEQAYLLDPISDCRTIISLLAQLPETLKYADTDSYLGDAYYYCDEPALSRKSYENSLLRKPNAHAYCGLGNIELYVNRAPEKAKTHFLKALTEDARFYAAYQSLGWADYEMGRLSFAESNFMKALDIEKSEMLYEDVVLFYIKSKQFDKAKDLINQYESYYGSNYISEGYELIIELYNTPQDQQMNKIEAYNKQFGEEARNWSSRIFEELRDN